VKRAFGGGDAVADTSGGRMRGGGNAKGARESYDFWISKGLSPAQAAGLVGMEQGESNFEARARGDGGVAHGAFQHHPDRRAKILRATGIDISSSTHQQQLEAAWWEMNNSPPEKRALAAIRRTKTPGEAAAAGVYLFERPADKAGQSVLRGQFANRWYKQFAGGKPDTPIVAASTAGARTFNPGRTSVDDLMRSGPMGSTSSTDNSRTVTQQNPTTVNVYGATDPQATASAVTRGVSSAHDMSLRNVQTAIR
jgi:hypothetical protein